MPTLFETKYPNNSRVVSGVVTIYRDDVVLLCDTSVAPVTINLFDIPDNYWSTQWKLYIIDNSNNASVNNITINAGVGQLINTQASLVLNTNGSGALIRIVSNTNFLASFMSGSSSGGYNLIKDEGIALPQRTTMDFLGEFVKSLDDGSETEIYVNPTIKELTSAELNTLISTNSLIQGLEYKVIDTPYLQNITLMAISDNKVELEGKGLLFVADYSQTGDYSSVVPAFNSQLGLWNGALVAAVGDVVIWNNVHYVNLTGVNTTTYPNFDLVNWSLLTKSTTTGYILESVISEYDASTNKVLKITDVLLNEIELAINSGEDTFKNFPFGNKLFAKNKIVGFETVFPTTVCNAPIINFESNIIDNSKVGFDIDFSVDVSSSSILVANNVLNKSEMEILRSDIVNTEDISFIGNFLLGGSLNVININHGFLSTILVSNNQVLEFAECSIGFSIGSTIIGTNPIYFQSNYVNNNGSLYVKNIDSTTRDKFIESNLLWNSARVELSLIGAADFKGNRIYYQQNIDLGTLANNNLNGFNSIISKDESTFKAELDLTDPLIYDAINFTLNLSNYQWAGEFLLQNGAGNLIKKLLGYTIENRPVTLIANSGVGILAFRLGYVAIGIVVADEIVDNTNLTVKTNFTGYSTRNERAKLIRTNSSWFIQSRENWT